MILTALNDYYQRLQEAADHAPEGQTLAPTGYSVQKIAFVVVLERDGRLAAVEDARVPDPYDKKGKRKITQSKVVPGGAKPTGVGVNPCFLWDNAAYMLGFRPDDPKTARTRQAFAAFRERHSVLEKEINDPEFSAVCRFLETWTPERASNHPELAQIDTGFGVFRIRGQVHFVHERPAVRRYWQVQLGQAGAEGGAVGQCLVTGTVGRLARIHEPKIKGVLDAQSAGAALVSFNFGAAESYGKEQSFNAPVGEAAAFRYANALNHLLRSGSRQRVQIGDATTVFWTARPTEMEVVFGRIVQPGPGDEEQKKEVEAVLRQIACSTRPPDELGDPETPFYVLGLAANAARLSVRFWHVVTVGALIERLSQHFQGLSLDGRAEWEPEFPGVQNLLEQTAREHKDVPPVLGGALMRAILEGTPYPDTWPLAVQRRIRADRRINHARAASLKAHLNRNHQKGVPVSLDPNRPEPAYQLGRLFAVLEKAQADALGDLNATIKDRHFGAASATPRRVFPRLLRLSQHHIRNLENPGRRASAESRLQEIIARFRDFPARLNLQEQGLFVIGYYHQRQALFAKNEQNPANEAED